VYTGHTKVVALLLEAITIIKTFDTFIDQVKGFNEQTRADFITRFCNETLLRHARNEAQQQALLEIIPESDKQQIKDFLVQVFKGSELTSLNSQPTLFHHQGVGDLEDDSSGFDCNIM